MVDAPYTRMTTPRHFGVAQTPVWKRVDAARTWELEAARQQHELSLAVREWKRLHRKSDEHFARALGVHPETIGRYLRGEVAMNLPAFNHIAHMAGIPVTISLGDDPPQEDPDGVEPT